MITVKPTQYATVPICNRNKLKLPSGLTNFAAAAILELILEGGGTTPFSATLFATGVVTGCATGDDVGVVFASFSLSDAALSAAAAAAAGVGTTLRPVLVILTAEAGVLDMINLFFFSEDTNSIK